MIFQHFLPQNKAFIIYIEVNFKNDLSVYILECSFITKLSFRNFLTISSPQILTMTKKLILTFTKFEHLLIQSFTGEKTN